jgi:prepilin-type processing-associated H-X9-DG protein
MRIRLAQFTSRNGFTLIDAIFTAGVIGLLVMVAFPAWAHSAAEARTRLCAGNLGQIGRAAAMYASEHNDVLPGNQHSRPSWVESLSSYAPTNSYRCPEERVSGRVNRAFTIALNDFLTPHPFGTREADFSKRARVPAPAETMMFGEAREEFRAYDHFHFADARENGYKPEAFVEQVDTERHDGTANYLFLDGHVEELQWSSGAKPKLTLRASRFVRPDGVEEAMGLVRK